MNHLVAAFAPTLAPTTLISGIHILQHDIIKAKKKLIKAIVTPLCPGGAA